MELSLILAYFLQGVGLSIPATTTPGPFQAMLFSETLLRGFRHSAILVIVPVITDAPIIVLMLFILKQLPPIMINVLNVAGGLFVLYLAWNLFRQWRANKEQQVDVNAVQASAGGLLRKGILMNFLNPNPYLFWGLVSGPILIDALNRSIAYGVAFLIGFYGMFVVGLLLLAVLFHQARRLEQRLVRWLLLLSIMVLVLFGVLLLRSGFGG